MKKQSSPIVPIIVGVAIIALAIVMQKEGYELLLFRVIPLSPIVVGIIGAIVLVVAIFSIIRRAGQPAPAEPAPAQMAPGQYPSDQAAPGQYPPAAPGQYPGNQGQPNQ